jgi:hypothetical protein
VKGISDNVGPDAKQIERISNIARSDELMRMTEQANIVSRVVGGKRCSAVSKERERGRGNVDEEKE